MDNQQERVFRNNTSYAYILGVYMGDGCVTNQHGKKVVFKVNTIDKDFAEACLKSLNDLTVKNSPRTGLYEQCGKGKNPYYQVSLVDKFLCNILVSETEYKTKIPEYIWNESLDFKKQFIVGLMDSEGYVAQKKTIPSDCKKLTNRSFFMGFKVCDSWALTFAKLLNSIGIRTGKIRYEKIYGLGTKTPIHFGIKMSDWCKSGIKFNILRKQNRVDTWFAATPYAERSIRPKRLSSTTLCPTSQDEDKV